MDREISMKELLARGRLNMVLDELYDRTGEKPVSKTISQHMKEYA